MDRRELIALLVASASGWPRAADAQQAMPVIGFLRAGSLGPSTVADIAALREGLREEGYVDGQNVAIEFCGAEDHPERLPKITTDLVARRPVAIVATSAQPIAAAQAATTTIPIVFWFGGDPVDQGLVTSLAHPGGNLTGFALINNELGAKRLSILRELVPKAAVFALLVNPATAIAEAQVKDAQAAARAKGVQLRVLNASTEAEIEAAFANLATDRINGMTIAPDTFFFSRREQLVALAAKYAVPTIYTVRDYAASGGLISYAGSGDGAFQLIGRYVGRILNGENRLTCP